MIADADVRAAVLGIVAAATPERAVAAALDAIRRLVAGDDARWWWVTDGRRGLLRPRADRPGHELDGPLAEALRSGRPGVVHHDDADARWRTVVHLPHGSPGAGVVVEVLHREHRAVDPDAAAGLLELLAVAVPYATALSDLAETRARTGALQEDADRRTQESLEVRRLAEDLIGWTGLESALARLSERIGATVYVRRSPALGRGPAEEVAPYSEPAAAGEEDRAVSIPGTDVATLRAVDPDVPSAELLERVAVVVGLALSRQRAEIETEMRLAETVVEHLLAGDVTETQKMWFRASLVGMDLAAPHVWVWLGEGEPMPRVQRDRIRAALRRLSPRSLVLNYRGDVVVQWMLTGPAAAAAASPGGRAEAVDGLRAVVAELVREVGRPRLVAGTSDLVTAADSHTGAVREARFAHRLADGRHDTRVLPAADLGMYRLFAHVAAPEALRASADAVLAPLLRLPATDRTELMRTLRTHLEHDRRLAPTARALHVHVNTLRYRVGRIETLLGQNLDDADVRTSLHMALRIRDITAPGS